MANSCLLRVHIFPNEKPINHVLRIHNFIEEHTINVSSFKPVFLYPDQCIQVIHKSNDDIYIEFSSPATTLDLSNEMIEICFFGGNTNQRIYRIGIGSDVNRIIWCHDDTSNCPSLPGPFFLKKRSVCITS
jgi:hypothetical protein